MITVVVQDEQGNNVTDPLSVPTGVLVNTSTQPRVPCDRTVFRCLCFVDPYGDTTFNQLQFEPLLEDIRRLRALQRSDAENAAILQIEKLVTQYQNTPGMYIKFIGD